MKNKNVIGKSKEYIESIGRYLYIEKFDDGTEFYCLLDRYGSFNIADTGRTLEEIKERIDFWEGLVARGSARAI